MAQTGTFRPGDLAAVAERMRELDICMLSTRTDDGIATRPMSNNAQVEYDGDTWFFARRASAVVRQIETDPTVALGYIATERGTWIAIDAEAAIDDDANHKRERWFEELRRWFENGPDDPEVVLIRATAMRIRAWGGDTDLDVRRAD
jgi:general stress protein 26